MWVLSKDGWDTQFVAVSERMELLTRRAGVLIHPRSEKLRLKLAERWKWDAKVGGWFVAVRYGVTYWIQEIEVLQAPEAEWLRG